MNCPNCNNHIGCACNGGSQLVSASDGKQVCTKCKDTYEAYLVAIWAKINNIKLNN